MIPKFLPLHGVTRANRHEMISRVREAIREGGAYITDFHMFSNTAICINFEVSVSNVERLSDSLGRLPLLDQESSDLLTSCRDQTARLDERDAGADIAGTLEITFVHDEPDLRIEVPPVPG